MDFPGSSCQRLMSCFFVATARPMCWCVAYSCPGPLKLPSPITRVLCRFRTSREELKIAQAQQIVEPLLQLAGDFEADFVGFQNHAATILQHNRQLQLAVARRRAADFADFFEDVGG